MKRFLMLFVAATVCVAAFADGETMLTRGCKMVRLHGTYKGADGVEKRNVSIDCVWGAPAYTSGADAIRIASSSEDNPGSFNMLPPMEFFRQDKDVTREENFTTGVGVMLGDKARQYVRFCSYFISDSSSAAYLETGNVVAVDGKQKMSRSGVFIIETADFYNVSGKTPRAVVSGYNPRNDFYLNALWSFFERMYKAYVPKR